MQRGLENYKPVKQRIHEFREEHPDWTIRTKVHLVDQHWIAETRISDADGRLIANGNAYEQANKAFDMEKAETSSVGRALVFAGWTDSLDLSREEQERSDQVQGEPKRAATGNVQRPTPIRRETTPPEFQIDGLDEPPIDPDSRVPVIPPRSVHDIATALPVQSAPKAVWRDWITELAAATAEERTDLDWKLLAAGKKFDECTTDDLRQIAHRAAEILT